MTCAACRLLKTAGVALTFESFPRTESLFVTAADALEAIGQKAPGLKLLSGSGNAAAGEDPADMGRPVRAHPT